MGLELIPFDKHWAREVEAEGNASLRAACSNFAEVAPFLEDAVDAHLALYKETAASAPWVAYLARLSQTREIVGTCAFKDKPVDGRVEIACFTFPCYEGCGFGTGMARQLTALALRHPDVAEVVAHTCPEESAAGEILRGLGFTRDAGIAETSDGPAWRWSFSRGAHEHRRQTSLKRAMEAITLFA